MNTIVLVLCTIFVVYNILLSFGVFEFTTKQRKVVNEIKSQRSINNARKREKKKLEAYATSVNMFKGILMSEYTRENHEHYIIRLGIRSDVLNRAYTPEELRGKYALPFMLSLLFIPLGVFNPLYFIIPVAFLIRFFGYQTTFKLKISDEDTIIENYFIDLYLLLYSKLRQGSRARLQGTVESYVDLLEHQAKSEVTVAMLNFSRYFMNLLALYEDHVAVPLLKDVYKSSTVINFCNVCQQALQGVDNQDNLLTFKMQLVERRTNLMRENSAKLLRRGERSIYAIWVILFIFVICGWASKLPTGFF